jgi:AraC family transcriptional regulator
MTNSEPARPEWRALEYVHRVAEAEVALVSPQRDWNHIAATRFWLGQVDVRLPPLGVPAFGINYGPDMRLERTLHGRRVTGCGAAGYLSLLPPDAETRWVFDKPGDIVLVCLNRQLFDEAIEEGSGRPASSVEIVPQFVIRDLVLERIAHLLLKEIAEPSSSGLLRIEQMAQDLAAHLLSAHSSSHRAHVDRPHTLAPSRFKRAEEFILENLDAELSLRDIARSAGMSLFHFAKAFKQASGQSPHRYVKEQRLRRARTLLHDKRLTIAQVAEAVGLSHSYFTAEFREHMGMTPTKFRDVLQA